MKIDQRRDNPFSESITYYTTEREVMGRKANVHTLVCGSRTMMGSRKEELSRKTQELALRRQSGLCGSCGSLISAIGKAGQAAHKFGESAQAHHIKHVKFGGTNDLANCVVLCSSCHYSAHEGGNYRFGTIVGTPNDFPYYKSVPPHNLICARGET